MSHNSCFAGPLAYCFYQVEVALYPDLFGPDADGDFELPWRDPVSGEVDYEAMASDLGADPVGDEYDDEVVADCSSSDFWEA